jgi:hypothetical protein
MNPNITLQKLIYEAYQRRGLATDAADDSQQVLTVPWLFGPAIFYVVISLAGFALNGSLIYVTIRAK